MTAAQRVVVQKIGIVLRRSKTIFLTGHERPDGDTVGSELAMGGVLRRMGKKVTLANVGPIPDYCRFLKGSGSIRTAPEVAGQFDAAVVFECSGPDRMGNIIDLKRQARTSINIDHHAHHGTFATINLINPDASSNSEQLCQIFAAAGVRINKAEATALYVGLVTDTGRFQQENTRPGSHVIAAHLMEAGVDVAEVYRHVYGTRSAAALKLMSRALGSLTLKAGGRIAVIRLTRKDFAETRAQEDDTEDIPNQGLLPPQALVSLFLREVANGQVKVSMRGKQVVDLCAVAVRFGGGGHKNASGVTLPGPLARVEDQLVRAIDRAMK